MSASSLIFLLLCAFYPQGDEEAAARGRLFYRTGQTEDNRRVNALMGNPPTAVPASVLPCVNCHGRRGYGRPEGGMIPADITWDVLTRPYELVTGNGRRRPAYDTASLIRAITEGIDSGGAKLDANMPRYQLDADLAADLVQWIRRMQMERDPGIGEAFVRIGLLGEQGQSTGRLEAATAWRAFALDLAQRGGIYGRRLELVPLGLAGDPVGDSAALRSFLNDEKPFMLVMLGETAVPPHLAELAHRHQIPFLGGRSLAPPSFHEEVFYLFPGEGAHGQAMAAHVENSQGQGLAAILTRPGMEKAAQAIIDFCVADGWLSQPQIYVIDPQTNAEHTLQYLVSQQPEFIFNMGVFDTEVDQLATFLEAADRQVTVLSPVSLTTSAWMKPRKAWQQLLMTAAVHPKDLRRGAPIYTRLVRDHQLPAQPNGARLAALASAELLQGTLLSVGRELSREALITQLEAKFRFQSGFAPALSFGPNRRIGAEDIYLYEFDFEQQKPRFVDALSLADLRDGI